MRYAVLLLLVGPVAAQPFSSLEVSASASADVNRGVFDTYWTPALGGELAVRTPFYAGSAEVFFGAHTFDPKQADVPLFYALMAGAGWGVGASAGRVGGRVGLRAGTYRMTFDDDTFRGWQTESELLLGATAQLRLRLAGPLHAVGHARFHKTFTYIRLQQVLVGGGLMVRLRTPGSVQRVLE